MKTTTDTYAKQTQTGSELVMQTRWRSERGLERLAGVNHCVIHIAQQLSREFLLLTRVHAVCTRVVSSVHCDPFISLSPRVGSALN